MIFSWLEHVFYNMKCLESKMELKDLEQKLNQVQWARVDVLEEVDLALEEDFLIQTLKDMADTSWGRDTLNYTTIMKWLDNFKGQLYSIEYERILALILAVHMVYYNESDICHLVRLAYRKLLHDIMEQESIDPAAATASMVFLPLGTVSESGPFLSYYFRKENSLPTEFFVSSLEMIDRMDNVKNIILIDDVSISGGQADWYIREMKKKSPFFEKILNSKNVYALFLISTIAAKEKLKLHKINLCAPILMDKRSRCFHEESSIYKIFDKKIRDIVRDQSKAMVQHYGCPLIIRQYMRNGEFQRLLNGKRKLDEKEVLEKIEQRVKEDALGYGDAQVLIAFEYNTPNNTLPIIWADDQQWNPLFKRYDKVYSRQIIGGFENERIFI